MVLKSCLTFCVTCQEQISKADQPDSLQDGVLTMCQALSKGLYITALFHIKSLIIKEGRPKPQYHLTLVRMAIIKQKQEKLSDRGKSYANCLWWDRSICISGTEKGQWGWNAQRGRSIVTHGCWRTMLMSSIQSWFPVAGHLHLAHSIVLQNSSSPGAGILQLPSLGFVPWSPAEKTYCSFYFSSRSQPSSSPPPKFNLALGDKDLRTKHLRWGQSGNLHLVSLGCLASVDVTSNGRFCFVLFF